jgi:hypothetical protein
VLLILDLQEVGVHLDQASTGVAEVREQVVARSVTTGAPDHLEIAPEEVIAELSELLEARQLEGVVMKAILPGPETDPVVVGVAPVPAEQVGDGVRQPEAEDLFEHLGRLLVGRTLQRQMPELPWTWPNGLVRAVVGDLDALRAAAELDRREVRALHAHDPPRANGRSVGGYGEPVPMRTPDQDLELVLASDVQADCLTGVGVPARQPDLVVPVARGKKDLVGAALDHSESDDLTKEARPVVEIGHPQRDVSNARDGHG